MEVIYILEFGGQYTDLIGNCLVEMGFPVSYVSSDVNINDLQNAAGIIPSGGPKSVNQPDRYPFDPNLFTSNTPSLGICYGMQLLGSYLQGGITQMREYGETRMRRLTDDPLFSGLLNEEIVWMNHGDSLLEDGDYTVLARTEKGVPAAIKSNKGPHYGVQFHPEVTHTKPGRQLLRNFAQRICGMTPQPQATGEFDPEPFISEALAELRERVGNKTAFVFTSGGVDSSVAAKLASMAGLEVLPVYLDMGNGRKGEAAFVSRYLGDALEKPVHIYDRGDSFVEALHSIDDPEDRRKRFGELYADMGISALRELGLRRENAVFIDGTIATDKRETGQEAGKGFAEDRGTVATIKTHHNPLAHLMFEEIGDLVAPLRGQTKGRVRRIASYIQLVEEICRRPPFPGPGFFVRFDTAYYPVPALLAGEAAAIASEFDLDGVVLPRKGVGLKGDNRAYEHAALLAGERDWSRVRTAAKSLIEDLPVARVLYSPREVRFSQHDMEQTIDFPMTSENLNCLREATAIVEETMDDYGVHPSQTPVIMTGGHQGPLIIIRDFDSEDFRTGRPLVKPNEFPWGCYDAIERGINQNRSIRSKGKPMTVFDVSDKPGGTTEWF